MQPEQTAAPRSLETSVTHAQPDGPTTTHIRISTFGLLRLEWVDQHSGHAAAIPQEKLAIKDGVAALWLLKLLLSQPHRYALRDEIMEHLWPEASSSSAAKRLDNVVYALRKLLRPPGSPQVLQLIQGHTDNGNGYQLAAYPHIWVDADSFAWHVEQAARMERFGEESLPLWEAASHLAERGTYLADERYSDWAMQRRASLEGQYRQCAHRLAALYRQHGHSTLAELRLRTYWQTHPTDEDALRVLLELLGEQERYQEAQACYQHLLAVLQEEGRDPDERTRDIAEYLRTKQITRQRTRAHPRASEQVGIIRKESSLSGASYVSAESGVLVPAHLVFDTSPQHVELLDGPTWCAEQITDFQALLASWQEQGVACSDLQGLLHAELERWTTMVEQPDAKTGDVFPTRRTVLAALAMLPSTLLTNVQAGPLTALLLEEFLAQSAASLTACWHLVNADGFAAVEYALPRYLPLLVGLARQPSSYQQTAAYLAAQGSLLMYLISYHRLRLREELAYARQAVELADTSGNRDLHVSALVWLGGTFKRNGQPKVMLQKCQEAARYVNEVVPLLRSSVLAELAYAYARNGQTQDALHCTGQARSLFPSELGAVPLFISANYGLCQLVMFEGRTHLALGESDAEHVQQHSQQASNALAQVAQLPSTSIVPERYKVQIINYQAAAAVGKGNMEEFEHYLLAGVAGAKALGSEKRRQEAMANWRAARKAWPGEEKIFKLADVLMEL